MLLVDLWMRVRFFSLILCPDTSSYVRTTHSQWNNRRATQLYYNVNKNVQINCRFNLSVYFHGFHCDACTLHSSFFCTINKMELLCLYASPLNAPCLSLTDFSPLSNWFSNSFEMPIDSITILLSLSLLFCYCSIEHNIKVVECTFSRV